MIFTKTKKKKARKKLQYMFNFTTKSSEDCSGDVNKNGNFGKFVVLQQMLDLFETFFLSFCQKSLDDEISKFAGT